MSSYSTGSKSYYSVTSDDEEPTVVTSENHSDGSKAKLPSNGRKSPFYVHEATMFMSSTTPLQYTQGENTELPEHLVDSTGYLADEDDESDWDWNSETGDGPTSPVSVPGYKPYSFRVTAQDIPLPYSFTVGGSPTPMMGYPIKEYPDEDTQPTGDINSIYVRSLYDKGREDRALPH
ncbi:hypothetical protein L1987_18815 [Smallanthus sonchifolius]|uniref:Uncharacterized protein n=1 Tax=Smallanthus sonchifolius TaxID=185202 RepID=A0ACB9J3E0_9ASTR|nr:hypothetical protein L1987_18815 [Smallanthus sonchifolius]